MTAASVPPGSAARSLTGDPRSRHRSHAGLAQRPPEHVLGRGRRRQTGCVRRQQQPELGVGVPASRSRSPRARAPSQPARRHPRRAPASAHRLAATAPTRRAPSFPRARRARRPRPPRLAGDGASQPRAPAPMPVQPRAACATRGRPARERRGRSRTGAGPHSCRGHGGGCEPHRARASTGSSRLGSSSA